MSSIRDRLRRLHRPHAAEGSAPPVDEAERMMELERIMAADNAAPKAAAQPAPAVPRPAPAAPERPAARAQAPRTPKPTPPRAEPDDNELRVVPFDELEPSDNRLRRRKPEAAVERSSARHKAAEPLPQRTTIGKDTSFLSLLSTKRFEAWKSRGAESGAESGAEPEYDAERVWEPEVEPVRREVPGREVARREPAPRPTAYRESAPRPAARAADSAQAGGRHIAESLPGRWLGGEHGPCFAAFEAVGHDEMFGAVRVGEALSLREAHFRLLDRDGVFRSLDSAVFLDLETTGTEPSTDIPFVIGLGQPGRDSFDVEQLAIHHPGEELAALGALARRLKDVRALVTYNGQRFDLRFLRTRFAKYGLDPAPLELLHFDLYLMARNAWGRAQPRYRLVDLEQNVLGFSRVNDVPGAEAPLRYAQFRRTGDVTPILPIFEHNRHDIVAMFPLLGRIARQMGPEIE